MKKYAEYIQQVEIAELWNGRKHIVWHLDPEVNVLSGANGIGKSTILNRVVSGVKSLDDLEESGISIVTYPGEAQEKSQNKSKKWQWLYMEIHACEHELDTTIFSFSSEYKSATISHTSLWISIWEPLLYLILPI